MKILNRAKLWLAKRLLDVHARMMYFAATMRWPWLRHIACQAGTRWPLSWGHRTVVVDLMARWFRAHKNKRWDVPWKKAVLAEN